MSYVFIETTILPQTIGHSLQWQSALDAFAIQRELGRALYDMRTAQGNPSEVRDHMWAWIQRAEIIKVSALVVESSLLRVSTNMRSMKGVRVRSFHDVREATKWLVAQPIV